MITCDICKHSAPHFNTLGLLECHLNPPTAMIVNTQGAILSIFPPVQYNHWCSKAQIDQEKRKNKQGETNEQKTQ